MSESAEPCGLEIPLVRGRCILHYGHEGACAPASQQLRGHDDDCAMMANPEQDECDCDEAGGRAHWSEVCPDCKCHPCDCDLTASQEVLVPSLVKQRKEMQAARLPTCLL